MKKLFFISTIILGLTVASNLIRAQGAWTQKTTFPGTPRGDAFYFSIGTMCYMGVGGDASASFLNDVWQYDALNNSWTQKANFPGNARWQVVAFSIGSKGYVATGSGYLQFNDLWEYDPASDTWTQKASLPAETRNAGIGFSIGNKGYVGTGYGCSPVPCGETTHNDFLEYDPSTDSWTQKASIPTNGRAYGFGLSIGSKGYIGGGEDGMGTYFDDFWEYNPMTDTWTQKSNLPAGPRDDIDGGHFSIGNYGYVGTGVYSGTSVLLNDFWRYNPSADSWTQIPNLPAQSRIGTIGFSINNKGYIGTGFTNFTNTLDDLWSFRDTIAFEEINETELNNLITISPNPVSEYLTVVLQPNNSKPEIKILNMLGEVVYSATVKKQKTTINVSTLASGVYLIEIATEANIERKKFIKQ